MAAKDTIPHAKNVLKRALRAAVDPHPNQAQIKAAAEFFDHQCAYCGTKLPEEFHSDHLVPARYGGSNHISNRVPACPECNEKEKLDKPWEVFLRDKAGDAFEARKARILEWLKANPGQGCTAENVGLMERCHKELCKEIDGAVEKLRKARKGQE
jgi:hypothetical protein